MPIPRELPHEVKNRLVWWLLVWNIFLYSYYILGGTGAVISALVATNALDYPFSLISAACIALMGFVKPEERYRAIVKAWTILAEEASRYRYQDSCIEDLFVVMSYCEHIVSQGGDTEAFDEAQQVLQKLREQKETWKPNQL